MPYCNIKSLRRLAKWGIKTKCLNDAQTQKFLTAQVNQVIRQHYYWNIARFHQGLRLAVIWRLATLKLLKIFFSLMNHTTFESFSLNYNHSNKSFIEQ